MINELKRLFGDDFIIEEVEQIKNNGVVLEGIQIRKKGENIGEIFYLNESITPELIFASYGKTELPKIDFTNKSKIYIQMLNAEKNRELLDTAPHFMMNDLAGVYRYDMGSGTCLITNNNLGAFELSEEELKMVAVNNLLMEKPKYIKLSDVFGDESVPMVVMTSETMYHGARMILRTDEFSELANKMNDDIYIIPCSVHEIIILPTCLSPDKESTLEMIREINRDVLKTEDFLSDNLYVYRRETGKIEIA